MAAKWSEVHEIPITGDKAVSLAPANYYGFTFRETTGTEGAIVRIYDADSASGGLLDSVSLAPNESAREFYPLGLRAENGIYVDVVSGTVEGSVRVAD